MPALTIPGCGFCEGTKPELDAGVQSVISEGGQRRGWSNYDAVKERWTFVFDTVTPSERTTMRAEYITNRVTGAMTVTPPGAGFALTLDYEDDGYSEEPRQGLFWQITLRMRER